MKRKPLPIWRLLAVCLVAISILTLATFRRWTARNRPASIAGTWYLDDLRTVEEEKSIVTFSTSGAMDGGDYEFGARWRYRDGKIFFRTWKLSEQSTLSQSLTNSTAYSWFAESDEFSLVVKFSDDGSTMTLISADTGPRCLLRRLER